MPLRIGDWYVDPVSGQMSRAGQTVRVEARTMRLLLCLAERAGEVVSIDELLDHAWAGVIVTPDSVYQAITSLRRLLGDDPKQPKYIATVTRLGYRMVATVSSWIEQTPADHAMLPAAASSALSNELPSVVIENRPNIGPRRRSAALMAAAVAVLLILTIAYLLASRYATPTSQSAAASLQQTQRSIGVLPFLDLTTQAMNEEYFADGMTEELIDHLSKIPGLKVPTATSSFYFKDKQLPVAEIAQKLGVVYLLDGSIRKSDATLRVAARLIRAADGYVVWTETYDRPMGDVLKIQKDIAGEATQSLQAAIDNTAGSAAVAPGSVH